jgi:hypothetical protein
MIFAPNLRLLLKIQEAYLTTLSAKFSSPVHLQTPAFCFDLPAISFRDGLFFLGRWGYGT